MGLDAREVANFVLDRCRFNKRDISNLSLQKIIYFCHVWHLIKTGQPLVAGEFEAWEFGPVMPCVYREFKQFGDDPITAQARKLDTATGERVVANYSLKREIKPLLDEIVDTYSSLSAFQLVEISHVENGPWYKSWHHVRKINPGMRITNESIREFYSKNSSLQ